MVSIGAMVRPRRSGRAPKGLDEAFGRVLREMRRKAGLSQEALWSAADRHRNYVSLLENGKNSPSLRTVFVIADALGVKPSEMVAAVERELGR
jgi:transcriptional regulator with XRE-family HTH domain